MHENRETMKHHIVMEKVAQRASDEGGGSVHSREEEKLGGGETDSPRHRFLKRPNYLGTSIGMPTYTNLGSGAGPSATITVLTGASDTLT